MAIWALLYAESMLLVEVNVSMMKEKKCTKETISLKAMAGRTMGSKGENLVATIYLFLSYTVIMAYISKVSYFVTISLHQSLSFLPVCSLTVFYCVASFPHGMETLKS